MAFSLDWLEDGEWEVWGEVWWVEVIYIKFKPFLSLLFGIEHFHSENAQDYHSVNNSMRPWSSAFELVKINFYFYYYYLF